ncbi:MAG: helix-turn-helix domain-containing protein, partial [Actinomycetota bacterium]|nr:helix-turn-helix domain-containing protein [Actinomycetota bacterium]
GEVSGERASNEEKRAEASDQVRPVPLPAADLQPRSDDHWLCLEVPEGWEPIARICRRVLERRLQVSERIVDCILEEIPAYRGGVPREDLSSSVIRNMEMMFCGVAENRLPSHQELEIRRELGRRRALQGHPIDALLQAYHVGYRELWLELVAEARNDEGGRSQELLLTAASTFWGWIQNVTSAVADAYDETVRTRESLAARTRQRFVELVISGDLDSEEMVELSVALGFALDREFQAFCVHPQTLEGNDPRRVQRRILGLEGTHHCVPKGPDLLVVSQGATTTRSVEEAILTALPGAALGVGLARSGLLGARQSIGDAEWALALAVRRKGISRFENDWLPSTLLRAQERLQQPLRPGLKVAPQYPHLAETVKAFSECKFSIAETGRYLSLHPNSVTYRLDRWHELTGWDPRTYAGLAKSLTALDYVQPAMTQH